MEEKERGTGEVKSCEAESAERLSTGGSEEGSGKGNLVGIPVEAAAKRVEWWVKQSGEGGSTAIAKKEKVKRGRPSNAERLGKERDRSISTGIKNKKEDFWKYILKFDVIGLTETWLEEKD
ncbi:hypothetical protein ALC62_13636 [Cyphomyrmex costatus]|uniref:Uncharacterized protein n=1 Tax=Cyphomyrmex costatus TaxID=456900 RepID=A0A151I9I0_9HYME|nr:hypothetical protein ALC62_13636 [Cyphomyrmex costatus]